MITKKILAIKTSRVPNRVYVSFSDGNFLPLFIDDLVLLRIKKDQEIENEMFEKMVHSSLFYLLYESALRQISYSPKNKIALKNKLSLFLKKNILKYKIGFDSKYNGIIDEVVLKVMDQGLLIDDDFLKFFIAKNSKKSNQELIFLLKRQGFSESKIKDFLPSENEIEKIKKILVKKNFSKAYLSGFKEKNKIISSLYRKGFSLDDIKAAIDCLSDFR